MIFNINIQPLDYIIIKLYNVLSETVFYELLKDIEKTMIIIRRLSVLVNEYPIINTLFRILG